MMIMMIRRRRRRKPQETGHNPAKKKTHDRNVGTTKKIKKGNMSRLIYP
jgi:hypothetical protein